MKKTTKNKNIVDIGDIRHSRLTHTLSFTVACSPEAIRMVEDFAGRNDMTAEETAEELRKVLETGIFTNYHRGGLRIKYS